MMTLEQTPDYKWWEWGDYNGKDCVHCGRERVMVCDAPDGSKHEVCEKCCWDATEDEYASVRIDWAPSATVVGG